MGKFKKQHLIHDIATKKAYGQHFLRDHRVIESIVDAVSLNEKSFVLEIGPGDGALTKEILERKIKQLVSYEVDPEWAAYLSKSIDDSRFTLQNKDILQVSFDELLQVAPQWILLANLPYNITFPILEKIQKSRDLFLEGVIMIQEEVAQKIVAKKGRGYGFISLFYQRYFEWRLLDKVAPEKFEPAPKVYSRLLHFIPKQNVSFIKNEADFWKFIRICFRQPRRTLLNNIKSCTGLLHTIDKSYFEKRAQELSIEELIELWHQINT